MTRRLLVPLVLLSLLAVACGASSQRPEPASAAGTIASDPPRVSVDDAMPCPSPQRVAPRADGLPGLELPCLGDGPPVRLSDLRGTPMVLNVWAAWCVNCPREMPLFAAVQEEAGERLRFFGIHYKASREQGLAASVDFGVTFPSVQDADGDRVTTELKVPGPPTTLFVAADGRLAARHIGEIRTEQELRTLVRRHLGVRL